MALQRFACPECGATLKSQTEWAGRPFRCPKCYHRFTPSAVPSTQQPAPSSAGKKIGWLVGAVASLAVIAGLSYFLIGPKK